MSLLLAAWLPEENWRRTMVPQTSNDGESTLPTWQPKTLMVENSTMLFRFGITAGRNRLNTFFRLRQQLGKYRKQKQERQV
jgi:hypothetical protein